MRPYDLGGVGPMLASVSASISTSIAASALAALALAPIGCGGGAGDSGGESSGASTPGEVTGGTEDDDDTGTDETEGTGDSGTDTSAVGSCGDAIVDPGEHCDDGEATATCNADCTYSICGDGTFNPLAGEGCDDGDVADGDACSSVCQPSVLVFDGPMPGWLDDPNLPVVATGDAFALVYMHGDDASAYEGLRYLVLDADGKAQEPIRLTMAPSYSVALGVDDTGAGLLAYLDVSSIEYRFLAPGGALDLDGGFGEVLANETWFTPAAPPAALGDGRFCVLGHTGGLRCVVDGGGLGVAVAIAPPEAMPITSSIDGALLQPRDGGFVASYVGYEYETGTRELRARAVDASGQVDGDEVTLMVLDQNGPEAPAGTWIDAAGNVRVAFGLDAGLVWHDVGASGPVLAGASGMFGDGVRPRAWTMPSGELRLLWRTQVNEELGPGHSISTCSLWLQSLTSELEPIGAARELVSPERSHCVTNFGAAVGPDGDLLVVWHRALTDAFPGVAYFEGMLLPAAE